MKKKFKCICFCSGEYPDYQAAAIRHVLLGRGLSELGCMVELWLMTPQRWGALDLKRSSGLLFVKFNYFCSGGKWSKALSKLMSIARLIKKMYSISVNKDNKNAIFIVYSTELFFLIPILIFGKIFKIPLIHERTEFPKVVSKKTLIGKISLYFYLNHIIRLFDKIMVINETLGMHLEEYKGKTRKLLTVVDVEEFRPEKSQMFDYPYIAYCGTMYGQKDGVDILIRSFSMLSDKYPEWKLVLVGDISRLGEIEPLIKLINERGIESKVVFTGRVLREEVALILRSAKLLALAKPANEQNSGNFPIKLGEYLATGVPVLVTNVGEIPRYIEDGVTGYLSDPTDDSFSKRLDYIMGNLAEAEKVGLRGSLIAEDQFSYKVQAGVLHEVIADLVEQRWQ